MDSQILERPKLKSKTQDATKVLDSVIIGSGFAGLCMGIRLKKAGIKSFVIFEKAESIGGTWRDNTYPGAACDVESHLYSFSFEPRSSWSRQFGPQKEILNYMNYCADKYGLRPYICTNSGVTGAYFDEITGLWEVATESGEKFKARTVVSGTGGLSRPVLPNIKGIDQFKGAKFHSARWDHEYDLKGKTVAVIGTGASAIQIVPAIAPTVSKLLLFQRTAPWILPKLDAKIAKPVRLLFKFVPPFRWVFRKLLYWMHEIGVVAFAIHPKIMKTFEKLGRRYIAKKIQDPILQKQVTPNFTIGCKRVLLSNDYYPALTRENVSLIPHGIVAVTKNGVIGSDNVEHKVDAIVFATGFQAAEATPPFEVKGKNQMDLADIWKNGPEAYLGTCVSGFPNFFMIVGPNTGLGHSSMILMIESQAQYILQCIRSLRKKNVKYLDVKQSAQDKFNREIHDRLAKSVWSTGGCVSWYNTQSGKNTTLWPGFTFEFKARTYFLKTSDFEFVRTNGEKESLSFGTRFSLLAGSPFF
ncbi:4-hydroxyacetophenone monooxygenase [Leptospira perolatii]|uniref:4-hydroxyacetophenone monooxygenase n=1 Tax=Leptospira perolatii TaxID=2023191 RepID=A0A2M9ZI31_9LEPT|nr:NAD(P)/FAD-dependent oxidoreductase [Leptospira perolatii]PJZ68101.1 4-hydroxyacetophenone monooxygenase [Leptospira perolatii]PJZ71720.1 4-hydroxyacetophenone monooxygenase [Leptospira perolatii]